MPQGRRRHGRLLNVSGGIAGSKFGDLLVWLFCVVFGWKRNIQILKRRGGGVN